MKLYIKNKIKKKTTTKQCMSNLPDLLRATREQRRYVHYF